MKTSALLRLDIPAVLRSVAWLRESAQSRPAMARHCLGANANRRVSNWRRLGNKWLVPLIFSACSLWGNAFAAVTDCKGMSVDGMASCRDPDYAPAEYNVCDVAGTFSYRQQAWQACSTEMGVTGPLSSEAAALAYASCFDKKLAPTSSGVAGPVPWLADGTYYNDNLCVSGATVHDVDGHHIFGVGTLYGTSSRFTFTRREIASCPSGYTAVYKQSAGYNDIVACKANPPCPAPDQVWYGPPKNGCLKVVDIYAPQQNEPSPPPPPPPLPPPPLPPEPPEPPSPCPTAGKSANEAVSSQEHVADPIFPLSGTMSQIVGTPFKVGGIQLNLIYDTLRQFGSAAGNRLPSLGQLWGTNFHRNLVVGTGAATLTAYRGNRSVITYTLLNGTYVASANVRDRVSAVSGGYQYYDAEHESIETYNTAGQQILAEMANGSKVSFAYSAGTTAAAPAAGYLIQIADNVGRTLKFEYLLPQGTTSASTATAGLLSKVTDSAGISASFTYDSSKNLVSITWADNKSQQFLYESPALIWALTGLIDENGNRFSTWTYDGQGFATGNSLGQGVNEYIVRYASVPQYYLASETPDFNLNLLYRRYELLPPTGVAITRPNGESIKWEAAGVLGGVRLAGVTQPAGSGCGAASNAVAYDASGNVTQKDNMSGSRTCYAYDAQNREVVRVEGVAKTVSCDTVISSGSVLPAGARRITTDWHPDWRLPVRTISSGLLDITVYNGQPDPLNNNTIANCTSAANLQNGKPLPVVCKKVTQASLSGDGSVPSSVDLQFDKVSLLLHADGANGSQTFIDSSGNPKVASVSGNAAISTVQSKFGGASAYFDGASSSYISYPATGTIVGSGDITIEGWLYPTATSQGTVYSNFSSGGAGHSLLYYSNGQLIWYYAGNSAFATPANSVPVNQWTHFALVRAAAACTIFINGAAAGSASCSAAIGTTATDLRIGNAQWSSIPFKGYLDDFRISLGAARYISNFAAASTAFGGSVMSLADPGASPRVQRYTYNARGQLLGAVDANGRTTNYAYFAADGCSGGQPGSCDLDFSSVTLLLHANGSNGSTVFADNSALQNPGTVTGGVSVSTTQSVFGGSSAYFDGGASSFISFPSSSTIVGAGDLTIEGWVYPTTTAQGTVYSNFVGTGGDSLLYISNGQLIWYYTGSMSFASAANAAPLNQWTHFALVKNSSTCTIYVNGISSASTTCMNAIGTTAKDLRIGGAHWTSSYPFKGFLDDFRITLGKARYTGVFLTPSQEFPNQGIPPGGAQFAYSAGDLQSITNAAGHLTQFTQYDRAGRVRQTIDPKGVVTDITYTPRGWVSTVTTTAPGGSPRLTNYTYDGVGQLIGVTQPDGSTLSYSYDAAHRVVGATDAKGNSVSYTLDNVGNRIVEDIKDPTGVLQRNISRSFDALNRLQQVTGAAR